MGKIRTCSWADENCNRREMDDGARRLKGTRESVNHGWGGEGGVSNNIMVGKIRNGEAADIGGSPSFQ